MTCEPIKRGRSVVAVRLSWDSAELARPVKLLGSPQAPADTIRAITPAPQPKAFPVAGSIAFSKPWNEIAKLNGSGRDVDLIALDFRNWCKLRRIDLGGLNIAKAFTSFCKRVKP